MPVISARGAIDRAANYRMRRSRGSCACDRTGGGVGALHLPAPPLERVGEGALERDGRLPAGRARELVVGAADFHHLVFTQEARVGDRCEPYAGKRGISGKDLADAGRAAGANVVGAGLRTGEGKPVCLRDVAHIGEVASHVDVAGSDLERLVGPRLRLGYLSREIRNYVDIGLPRASVVEG